jgi:hypothetical protein
MEELYPIIPFEILQIVRENRTVPLHKGKDKWGKRMVHWALDQIIELIQHKFKLMEQETSQGQLSMTTTVTMMK